MQTHYKTTTNIIWITFGIKCLNILSCSKIKSVWEFKLKQKFSFKTSLFSCTVNSTITKYLTLYTIPFLPLVSLNQPKHEQLHIYKPELSLTNYASKLEQTREIHGTDSSITSSKKNQKPWTHLPRYSPTACTCTVLRHPRHHRRLSAQTPNPSTTQNPNPEIEFVNSSKNSLFEPKIQTAVAWKNPLVHDHLTKLRHQTTATSTRRPHATPSQTTRSSVT
jgi:hypothetical protein